MKKFKEFIDNARHLEKQKEKNAQTKDETATNSIIKTGLEQSAQIASFKNHEDNS